MYLVVQTSHTGVKMDHFSMMTTGQVMKFVHLHSRRQSKPRSLIVYGNGVTDEIFSNSQPAWRGPLNRSMSLSNLGQSRPHTFKLSCMHKVNAIQSPLIRLYTVYIRYPEVHNDFDQVPTSGLRPEGPVWTVRIHHRWST